jgi:hypothetical protein
VDPVRRAAGLLAASSSIEAAAPLLKMLGFEAEALPLDEAAKSRLGLPECIEDASVVAGEGSLRVLLLNVTGGLDTRELLRLTASKLSARVPHLLWVLLVVNRPCGEISVACWEGGRHPPRIVALIASRHRIVESDADTICALAAAHSTSDILTHARWAELLGREAITRRFFRALRDVVATLAADLPPSIAQAERRELAILNVSRLLFLSFLESKGWLAGDFDFLANHFARCMVEGGGFHRRVLQSLFYGTLNTPLAHRAERARKFGRVPFLNGGLFTRSALERNTGAAFFSDDALGEAFSNLLTCYRFSAREESGDWSETAVDPEILGKAFEALMEASDRKTSGAFYTPQRLVEHATESALVAALSPEVDREMLRALLSSGEIPGPRAREKLLATSQLFRVLDPACGSGAFLVHALERIAELRIRLGEIGTVAVIRRKTLTGSIFGVDVNPMAVWLCQLRLWLSIVIDSTDRNPMHVVPLPNLDRQIRVGDSLTAGAFSSERYERRGRNLAVLRGRYARAVGARKKILARVLDREERNEAIEELARVRSQLHEQRRDILTASRAPDLFGIRSTPSAATIETLRALRKSERAAAGNQRRLKAGAALPFAFSVHFADIAAEGGFNVIIGNPPWVRLHNIGAEARRTFLREFASFNQGGWSEGARLAGSGRAFANQIDLASLFVERSLFLLRDGGALSLLLPAKLWRSLSGGGIRQVIGRNLDLVALEDLTESRGGFDAAVYPSLLVGRRTLAREGGSESSFVAAVHCGTSVLQWQMKTVALSLDHSAGSPWLLMPPEVRESFDALTASGMPLGMTEIGRPLLGVKTGCNSAFVLDESRAAQMEIEPALLRPVVRGESATRWRFKENGERILWTHSVDGSVVHKLPSGAASWLSRWRSTLERRADCHQSRQWWGLFRTEGASADYWRIVWGDFGKSPRALLLEKGSNVVPLNTCYVLRCSSRVDALALVALLNSPALASWLDAIAEPARGGYRRYLGWTVSLMPIPHDWPRAVEILAPLAEEAMGGNPPTRRDLLNASLRAYRLRASSVEALISWTNRS